MSERGFCLDSDTKFLKLLKAAVLILQCYFHIQRRGTNTITVPEVPGGKFEVPEIFMVSFDAVILLIHIPSPPGEGR